MQQLSAIEDWWHQFPTAIQWLHCGQTDVPITRLFQGMEKLCPIESWAYIVLMSSLLQLFGCKSWSQSGRELQMWIKQLLLKLFPASSTDVLKDTMACWKRTASRLWCHYSRLPGHHLLLTLLWFCQFQFELLLFVSAMLSSHYNNPHCKLQVHQKDLRLAVNMSDSVDQPLHVGSAVNEVGGVEGIPTSSSDQHWYSWCCLPLAVQSYHLTGSEQIFPTCFLWSILYLEAKWSQRELHQ